MTGQIPQSFIESLLSRIDIVDVVGARVNLRKAGANFIACCPFHHEKTPSFTVSPSKQFYHCFGCGVSGDAIQFLTEHDGLHFVEAVESLAARAGLTVPVETAEGQKATRYTEVYAALESAAKLYQQQLADVAIGKKAQDYLKSRGLTGKIAKQFGLGFAPNAWDLVLKNLKTEPTHLLTAGLLIQKEENQYYDRFRERVMFPIRDRRGRVVGFGGRVIESDQNPKYLNSPETPVFNKGSEVYGLYEARLANRHLTRLLVVEGYMDVVSLVQFGIKEAVATLGTALTDKQIDLLFKQAAELIFCFDGDEAGKKAAKRALPLILPHMKEGRRVRFMLLPQKEDPDSFVRKLGTVNFMAAMEKATPLSDFLFEELTATLDLHHLDSRAQLVTTAKPLIQLVPPGVLQQMLYNRLAELAGIDMRPPQRNYGNLNRSTRSNPPVMAQRKHPPGLPYQLVAMLLADRNLVSRLEESQLWEGLELKGIDLLSATIEILRFDSTISIEALKNKLPEGCVSQFSYDELKAIINHIPPNGMEQEFLGALQTLKRALKEQAMESLLKKAKTGVLSIDEKVQLKNLLDQKEKSTSG